MILLATGFAFALLLQGSERRAAQAVEDQPRPYIYYDYVQDGELRGGMVHIDPTNPLHVDLEPQGRTAVSPVTTLVDNGPTWNRIDLVFVGDGYTAGELGDYAADVDAVWPTFLAEPPLSFYAPYFNIHRVDVTSIDSGVDNDPVQGVQKQTALDMTYWCGGTDRLLCVNVGKANNQAANAPDVDSILALANSGTYGGAGYSDLGTLAGHNSAAIEIALHEFGHSFADLADEYDYGGPTTYSGPEPSAANVSKFDEAELQAQHRKWWLWLDLVNVAAFEGAMYSEFGIYRPTDNSKMRTLGRSFQAVNTERLVRHVYEFVRPIDDATPPGTYPLDAYFFVDPLDPVGHALAVQWYLDGIAIPGATATTLDAGTLGLLGGSHELYVEVIDNTPMVRDPELRATWLTDGRSWTLTNGHNVRPNGGPIASGGSASALLTLGGSLRPGGLLEFEIDVGPESVHAGAVPLFFVSQAAAAESSRPRHVDLGSGLLTRLAAPPWGGPGQPIRLQLALPDEVTLAERTFYAQGVLYDPTASSGRRLVWTNALEFVLER